MVVFAFGSLELKSIKIKLSYKITKSEEEFFINLVLFIFEAFKNELLRIIK